MTLILIEKGLVLEGSTPKIEDKQVPGRYDAFGFCAADNALQYFIINLHHPKTDCSIKQTAGCISKTPKHTR